VLDGLTPAFIDPSAIEYSNAPPKIFWFYTSLWDARRIRREMGYRHLTEQKRILREAEDDKLRHQHLDEAAQVYIASAEEFRDNMISTTGPVGLLGAALPGLGLGGLLGSYLIPRKKDTEKIKELESKLNGNS
jgi:hypothetical protein